MKINKSILMLGLAVSMICTGCGSSSDAYYDRTDSYAGSYNSSVDIESMAIMDGAYKTSGFGSNSSIKKNNSKTESYAEAPRMEEAEVPEFEDTDAEMTLAEEKLVYHCTLEIETTEYAESYSRLKDLINSYNGLIQSESETNSDYDWYYSNNHNTSGTLRTVIQCRIPSQNYAEFVENVSNLNDLSKVVRKSTSIENISQDYYDNKTRIEALEIQESRLLQMMEDADTINEMITVEDRLTEVQYDLAQLKTKLVYMDMDVAYSYVNITLEEVKEYTTVREETTFFTRLWDNIVDAWEMGGELFEELLNTIFHAIPVIIFVILPLILVAIFGIKLIVWIIKKLCKKSKFFDSVKKFIIGAPAQPVNNINMEVNKDLDENK